MLQGVKKDSSILKLEAILKSRYGMGFELKSVIDVEQVRKIDRGGLGFALIGEELHIPLRKEDTVLGTVVVKNAKELTSDSQGNIADLIKMALEPQVYKWHLDTKEANLKALMRAQPSFVSSSKSQTKVDGGNTTSIVKRLIERNEESSEFDYFDESSSKINSMSNQVDSEFAGDLISLNNFRPRDSEFEVLNTANDLELPRFIAPSILLRSESAMAIHKVAVQIHEYSERWAMIPYKDISDQVQHVQDIEQMGSVTLFIQDLATLSLQEQKTLAEYLATRSSAEQPLVLVGTSLSDDQLLKSKTIDSDFKKLLLKAHLEIDSLHTGEKSFRSIVELLFVESFKESNLEF